MSAKTSEKVTPEAFDDESSDPVEVREYYTRLLRGTVHNLNNILTIFQGYISILEMEAEGNEMLQEAFKHMEKGAEDADALLQEVLLAAGRVKANPREVKLSEVIELFEEKLPKTFGDAAERVQIKQSEGLPEKLTTDPHKLVTALNHLVENGLQAYEQDADGQVRVRVSSEDGAEGNSLIIVIEDDGEGISEEMLDQVCIPFVSTRKMKKQSGLGLPKALGILYALGGNLRIDSTPGQGTKVHITLRAEGA
jgi:signal transduction histidine kinase